MPASYRADRDGRVARDAAIDRHAYTARRARAARPAARYGPGMTGMPDAETAPDTFATASALIPDGDGRFLWHVPDGWQQGKGAFGGLVLGTLLRAMQSAEPDAARRVRSLSGELPAATLAVATEVTAEVLRRGGGTTFVEARARQGGATVARASALLAADRLPGSSRGGLTPPPLPPPDDIAPLPPPAVGSAAPPFTRHYEYRAAPPYPYTGASIAAANGWVRTRAPLAAIDAPAIIGLLDAWWPAALACETRVRPMATVTFTAELLVDPATIDPAAPLAYRARLDGVDRGFSVEVRELWQGERLLALNQQVFAFLA